MAGTAEPGARAFLQMDSTLFVAELRRRLAVPEATEDKWRPQCNGILDTLSLHAGTCVAGGEKTLRRAAVRDTFLYRWADRAGLQPEKARGAAAPTATRRGCKPTSPPCGYCPTQLQRCSCWVVAEPTGAWELEASKLLLQLSRRHGSSNWGGCCCPPRRPPARTVRCHPQPESRACRLFQLSRGFFLSSLLTPLCRHSLYGILLSILTRVTRPKWFLPC